MGRRIGYGWYGWVLVPEKQKTGLTCGLDLDLELDVVINPDFAGWRLYTRQLTTEAVTRRDTVH